jgi:solute carrier family 12 (sodium/potassium/chloride transporter), member 2
MKVFSLKNKKVKSAKFGAFNGVFVPTFLSIIGVILFLRLGYIVGSAGILPTILIIVLAVSVTLCTGLSLSSITTNIRIGSGGAYSIISKTLGLEVGGSVGIPLYLAQIFSVTLYLFGFSEAWKFIFPTHHSLIVIFSSFLVLFILTFISTKIAIKTQIIVFFVIIATIFSIFMSGNWLSRIISTPLIGEFPNFSFWALFSLFFPAVTGIMAGVGLSGELENPKRQIPLGLLSAIGVTTIIYIVTTFWLGYSATTQQLIENSTIMVTLSLVGPLVIAGILASTFSSALTTFVAAPRLLQSMSEKSLFPGSKFICKINKRGVPQLAILFSSFLIIITLFLGDLNSVAPVITMFFLLTYAIINIVVFIEQSIGLVSFRPTLKISRLIPLYGAIVSIIFMLLINALTGIISIIFIFISYFYLVKRKLKSTEGDTRSGLFITFSEWAAKKVLTLPESTKHTWKPNILLPVVNAETLLGNFPIIKSITFPNGTMTVLGLNIKKINSSPEKTTSSIKERKISLKELPSLIKKFGEEGIFTSSSTVTADSYANAVTISLEAIEGQTFPPNILFLPFKPEMMSLQLLKKIFKVAKEHKVGIVLSDRDKEIGLGSEEDIHIWLPSNALSKNLYTERNYDLALLLGYRLFRNWAGNLSIWMCVPKDEKDVAEQYVKKLLYEARFPSSTKIIISTKSFSRTLHNAPKGDIHLVPVMRYSDISHVKRISQNERKSFFFVMDSGQEDILA